MSFTTAVLVSVFFLIIAAVLGGLIIYFMLRNRLRVLERESKDFQRQYNKLKNDCEAKQKELQLEVSARDKKIGYVQENLDKSQKESEDAQLHLQLELAKKNEEIEAKNNRIKELEGNMVAALPPQQDHQAKVAGLQEQIGLKDKHIAELTKRVTDLENQLHELYQHGAKGEDLDKNLDKKQKALEKIREKAKTFDYSNIGVVAESDKDDLKIILGIGPFIEEKLHALGIYTFEQISKFTPTDIQQVTDAIEFFPGRIERDEWIKQAKEFVEKKKKGEPLV